MKGVGRIYQQAFIDTYSRVAFAKLYTQKHECTKEAEYAGAGYQELREADTKLAAGQPTCPIFLTFPRRMSYADTRCVAC